jgi:hypothetical protein
MRRITIFLELFRCLLLAGLGKAPKTSVTCRQHDGLTWRLDSIYSGCQKA